MFEIVSLQILSLTTHNARNMINISSHMNEIASNVDDCTILDDIPENSDETELDSVLCDESYLEDLVAGAASAFAQDRPTVHYVNKVNCAVHTLQLAVNGVLHSSSIQAVCKKLRSPLLSAELCKTGSKKAVLDNETRWNSTYEMACFPNVLIGWSLRQIECFLFSIVAEI